MFLRLGLLCLAAVMAAGSTLAQENDEPRGLSIVYYTHHECPEANGTGPGSSPDNPVDIAFDELWYQVSSDGYDDVDKQALDCSWVRVSGFMTWTDYYHYRANLHASGVASYFGDGMNFLVESFAEGSPPRSDLMRRQMTIVARFYSLCGAANRAQEAAGQNWWLFGPCHYSYNHGLMLSDVRVESVQDAAPQYLVGEANRALIGSLHPATPAERSEVEPVVRAWAASLQKGLRDFAEASTAQYPKQDEESRKSTHDFIEDADGYASYLLNRRNFSRVNLASAQIAIFRHADEDDEFRNAVGCICLEASCADRWPLTEGDADNYLGPAACVALTRWDGKTWNW
jgi:hypothetical protein